jgi:exopolysaccharide biosynthesis polyprenyl glycosylphosphotransferase
VNRAADVALAGLGLVVTSPLLGLAALAIKLEDGGPVFYRQTRVGKNGEDFELLKLRTMIAGAEKQGAGYAVNAGDPRITRVGAFLRRTSLDELPQLLNVLRGDMSLIGPRPERPEFVDIFVDSVHRYGDRHRVKAGVTGWAQVNGLRGKTSVSDRAEWDNYYIENWSLWLDVKILLMTVAAVVSASRRVE